MLVTKAGQLITTLLFAAPSEADEPAASAMLCASYPMQFLIRIDRHRQRLYYDCFEVS